VHLAEDIGQQQAFPDIFTNIQTAENFRIFKLTVGVFCAHEELCTKELIFWSGIKRYSLFESVSVSGIRMQASACIRIPDHPSRTTT